MLEVVQLCKMVPRAGLEPAQRERRGILNPLCLPIPPPGHTNILCDGDTILVFNSTLISVEARPGVEPRSTDLQSAA